MSIYFLYFALLVLLLLSLATMWGIVLSIAPTPTDGALPDVVAEAEVAGFSPVPPPPMTTPPCPYKLIETDPTSPDDPPPHDFYAFRQEMRRMSLEEMRDLDSDLKRSGGHFAEGYQEIYDEELALKERAADGDEIFDGEGVSKYGVTLGDMIEGEFPNLQGAYVLQMLEKLDHLENHGVHKDPDAVDEDMPVLVYGNRRFVHFRPGEAFTLTRPLMDKVVRMSMSHGSSGPEVIGKALLFYERWLNAVRDNRLFQIFDCTGNKTDEYFIVNFLSEDERKHNFRWELTDEKRRSIEEGRYFKKKNLKLKPYLN